MFFLYYHWIPWWWQSKFLCWEREHCMPSRDLCTLHDSKILRLRQVRWWPENHNLTEIVLFGEQIQFSTNLMLIHSKEIPKTRPNLPHVYFLIINSRLQFALAHSKSFKWSAIRAVEKMSTVTCFWWLEEQLKGVICDQINHPLNIIDACTAIRFFWPKDFGIQQAADQHVV